MKRGARYAAAICTVVMLGDGCATVQSGVPADGMRVMTYNIHAGQDATQQPNLERVAALIKQAGADVVLLQEIDRRTRRANGADHLAELERLTGMHAAFGKSLDYQGGDYGIAVLSRWPIDSVAVVPLAVVPPQVRSENQYEPRVGLYARVQAPSGRLHILNTHLDPAAEPTYRHQELIRLLAFARRAVPETEPMILGGDLNARDDTPDIAALTLIFTDSWRRCGDGGAGHTFPAHAPDRRIDYLLLRGLSCSRSEVLVTQASDHRPFIVTIMRPRS